MTTALLSAEPVDLAFEPVTARPRVADDAQMIRDAAKLTRDLNTAKPAIYWSDLAASAVLGYGGVWLAVAAEPTLLRLAAALVAVLALYRAGSFIHELTHMKASSVPGFRAGWNLLVGVPLMIPSFMYEGVHNLHHARTRYGTDQDPEYLPLALMRPATLAVFMLASIFAPVGLLVRYAVLAPLSLVVPGLRRTNIARFSSLSINPAFRRVAPEGSARRDWILWETLASVWTIGVLASVATGLIPVPAFLIALGIVSAVMVLNQVRTLVAHLWENDGEVITVTAQYLDTVNVPPPGLLPALWAPVGLRYHALHHLLPGVPYHSLGEAHRRLAAALPEASPYHVANHAGLSGLVVRLVGGSIRGRAA